jgi:hypothetical protein
MSQATKAHTTSPVQLSLFASVKRKARRFDVSEIMKEAHRSARIYVNRQRGTSYRTALVEALKAAWISAKLNRFIEEKYTRQVSPEEWAVRDEIAALRMSDHLTAADRDRLSELKSRARSLATAA